MRRLLVITALAFVVLVAGGAAADTFAVHLVSQTTNNITLGWTPQSGYGYLFSSGGVVRSRTNDPNRSSVTFAKVNPPSYDVDVIVKGANGHYDGSVVPPPTATITQTIVNGSTIANINNWRAVYDANGDGTEDDPGSIRFLVDGTQVLSEINAPFGDTFANGTITVSAGSHTFRVDAVNGSNVVVATNTVTATISGTPPPTTQCSDGIDNADPEDTLVDLFDPGCVSASDDDETNAVVPPPTGFPDASNTGVPAGTSLTAYTGPSNVTAANTVIDGKTIGCIQINAIGVVIRNSRISCAGGGVYIDDQANYARSSNATVPLVTIEDSEIDCQAAGGTAVAEADFVVRRVEITGCENGFDMNQNGLIEDSFIHNLYAGGGAHTDGLQSSGRWNGSTYLAGMGNVTIRHNTIYGQGAPNDSLFGTSAIISGRGGDVNVLIENNLLAGGAYTLYCEQGAKGTNYRVNNNRFSTIFKSTVGYYGPVTDCEDETASGNRYYESGLPVPGIG